MSVYSERMARVEVEVQELKEAFKEHKDETAKKFDLMNDKLDELLALRNKGAGVLWLLGGMLSAGVLGVVVQVLHYFGVK